MNKALAKRLINAATRLGGTKEFRTDYHSIREFIDDVCTDHDSESDIAGKIIDYFCYDEGVFDANLTKPLMLCLYFMTLDFEIAPDELNLAAKDLRIAAAAGQEQVATWAMTFNN